MKHSLFIVALLLGAAPAQAGDLVDAWHAALAHDPDYRGAEAARDAGREAAVQARALTWPSVQFQGSYQYNYVESNAALPEDLSPFFTGTRTSGRAAVGVQAVQPIYDASKRAQSEQLREKAAGAEVQFGADQQQLILRVAQSYFDVLAGEDKLGSYGRQVDAAEQQRRAAQARFDAGRARITDVREAEARRDASEVQRIAAEADLANARAAFTALTGLPAEGLKRPDARFAAPLPTRSIEDAARQAEEHSPQVKAAEHAARGAQAEISRYGLGGRPVVEGFAGYQGQYRLGGESGSGILPDRIQSASAGVRLTVPLYAGGAIRSKEREAQANATKAERALDAARRDARLSAQKAWHAVSTGSRRVSALGTAGKSAGAQQDAATIGRDVGIRTQSDVLDSQSQSFATARDEAQAIYDYLLARLQLAAATGELDGEQLRQVNVLIGGKG